jgi:ribosomal-protein-alanine N-acetyltransferase
VPQEEGRGIATSLLDDAWADAKERGITRATLEVAVSNQRAIDLYYRYGFRPVGVRKNYYERTNEDALILWADLQSDSEEPPPTLD